MLRLLQICNVGNVTGGTAACAWSITRALPDCQHVVAFPAPPTPETRDAFALCEIMQWSMVRPEEVARVDPDLVILHNTPRSRVPHPLPRPTLAYAHSRGAIAEADETVYCSCWLARQRKENQDHVLSQGVPRPLLPAPSCEASPNSILPRDRRTFPNRLRVGRICTPVARKWPAEIVPFTARLARRFPQVDWEFVGAPEALHSSLVDACGERCEFIPASWQARHRLSTWDALLYHHPTLTESFGRTVAEAMRAGCVPIVDARGGFVEQIEPECGFLCAREADFATAIDTLSDPRVSARMSHAARAFADERFSLASFRRNLLHWFERLARHS